MKVMDAKLHMLPASKFPVTIRLISKQGHELWSAVVERPPKSALEVVEIPGFAGTEHVPVKVKLEFGDGTHEEY